jgi:hypothetical protein
MLVRYHLKSRRVVWRGQVSSEGMKGTELTDFFSFEAKRKKMNRGIHIHVNEQVDTVLTNKAEKGMPQCVGREGHNAELVLMTSISTFEAEFFRSPATFTR